MNTQQYVNAVKAELGDDWAQAVQYHLGCFAKMGIYNPIDLINRALAEAQSSWTKDCGAAPVTFLKRAIRFSIGHIRHENKLMKIGQGRRPKGTEADLNVMGDGLEVYSLNALTYGSEDGDEEIQETIDSKWLTPLEILELEENITERGELVKQIIAGLNEKERVVVELLWIKRQTLADVAVVLCCSLQYVSVFSNKLKQKLAEKYGKQD